MPRLLIPALFLLTLSACETIVDIEPPVHEPQIVVNGLFRADSLWAVNVTSSVPLYSDAATPEIIRDATVVILEDGAVVDTLEWVVDPEDNFAFVNTTHASRAHGPVPGRTYTLRVDAPGFEPVEAVSYVPVQVPVTAELGDRTEGRQRRVQIRFTDPAGQPNYYKLDFIAVSTATFSDGTTRRFARQERFESSDALLLVNEIDEVLGGGAPVMQEAYFSGEDIDGQTYTIDAEVFFWSNRQDERKVRHYVRLTAITEDYYRFGLSLERQGSGNVIDEIEPFQLYSNVENGLGIFAGSNVALDELESLPNGE